MSWMTGPDLRSSLFCCISLEGSASSNSTLEDAFALDSVLEAKR